MIYQDRVYGKFKITEPAILELINCSSIQRLKGIDQAGYRPIWVKPEVKIGKYDHSRFAHSVGVYLLLRRYHAPIEEQIAGLIHDVSHSAFSHSIDYVFDAGSEKEHNHQDNIFANFVGKTEIPGILKIYGYNAGYILNDENFLLKETKLPDLCADRIDYSLRTAVIFNEITGADALKLLDNLTAENGDWIFRNLKSAEQYAKLFFNLNEIYWTGFSTAIMFRTIGDCMKYAIAKKYVKKNDFYTTDREVIAKIKKFLKKDEILRRLFDRMNDKALSKNSRRHYDTLVHVKSRMVDPLFKDGKITRKISDTGKKWKKLIKKELKPKKYYIKFRV